MSVAAAASPVVRHSCNLKKTIETFASDLPYRREPYTSRSWGHCLHSLCCYQGKLKPAVAHTLVNLFTQEGMTVLDPLGGVGTVAFEACLQGRNGITNDLSPLANAVATPKVRFPKLPDALAAIDRFQAGVQRETLSETDFEAACFGLNGSVSDFYHEDTLREVLKARRYFLAAIPSDADLLVKAAMLHVLHGNRPYALSRTSHPITPFHPSGEAVYRPVVEHVKRRILRLYRTELPKAYRPGQSIHGDFRDLDTRYEVVDSIITSPPFWGMRFDRPNWLRMWFCGWNADSFHVTSRNFLERQQTVSLEVYREFFRVCRKLLVPGGLMILHLGGSDEHRMLASLIAQAKEQFELLSVVAEDSTKHERHGIKDKGLTKTHNFIFLR
jgi:Putative RNA methylase family UPF0020